MSIYKKIKDDDVVFRSEEVYHNYDLTSAELGTTKRQFVSHSQYFDFPVTLNATQIEETDSHYFLKTNFYQTGSGKLNSPLNPQQGSFTKPTFRHKFNNINGGVFTHIPTKYVGSGIVRKSFKLIDNTFKDSQGKTIDYFDDGYGNIYASNAHISQSNNHMSHSDNYVGNIFYNEGIISITETGSFSGSLMTYNNSLSNYTASFQSINNIYTRTYNLKLNANEYNMTNNISIKKRDPSITSPVTKTDYGPQPPFQITNSDLIASSITGSKTWTPYVNSIGLYDMDKNLIAVASLSQPIQKRDDINLIFQIDLDF
tara:strand:- start:249 stop:1190 length:942 start_codon:yes stop_codon:yes gene_type:complete